MSRKVILQIIGLMDGSKSEWDGQYVVHYDPTFLSPGARYDGGLLEVTEIPALAQQFPDAGAALEEWRQPYGTRPDGCPNRPLTAFMVQVVPATQPTREERIALVRTAISAIRRARLNYVILADDPDSTVVMRALARDEMRRRENEFGWQWQNVEAILDDEDKQHGKRSDEDNTPTESSRAGSESNRTVAEL